MNSQVLLLQIFLENRHVAPLFFVTKALVTKKREKLKRGEKKERRRVERTEEKEKMAPTRTPTALVCVSEDLSLVNMLLLDHVCARYWLDKASTSVCLSLSSLRKEKERNVAAAGAGGDGMRTVVVLAPSNGSSNLGKLLDEVQTLMHSEGVLHVLSGCSSETAEEEREASAKARREIVLSGFTGVGEAQVTPVPENLSTCLIPSSHGKVAKMVSFSARKPQWQQGAKQGIRRKLKKKKSKREVEPPVVDREKVIEVWRLDENDDDLIDDDMLVDDIQVSQFLLAVVFFQVETPPPFFEEFKCCAARVCSLSKRL